MRYRIRLYTMVRDCIVAFNSELSDDLGDAWLAFEKFEDISATPFFLVTLDKVGKDGEWIAEVGRYEV